MTAARQPDLFGGPDHVVEPRRKRQGRADEPKPTSTPTDRPRGRQGGARRTDDTKPRRPRTPAELAEDNRRERLRIRARWYGRFGVPCPPLTDDPRDQAAADAEANAAVRAILDERRCEVAKGFTWVRGTKERIEDLYEIGYLKRPEPPP